MTPTWAGELLAFALALTDALPNCRGAPGTLHAGPSVPAAAPTAESGTERGSGDGTHAHSSHANVSPYGRLPEYCLACPQFT